MTILEKRRVPPLRRNSSLFFIFAMGAAWASVALGQQPDLKPLLAKIEPSIVRISLGDNNVGSGVVVDAAKCLVATNYHVIAEMCKRALRMHTGENNAAVVFVDDGQQKRYPIVGLVAMMPGKDLALVQVLAGNKKLQGLKIAEKDAATGQAVYAGVPLGFAGVLSSGTVAAVSSGKEIEDSLTKQGDPSYYKARKLDQDAVWIRVEAPISPGRDGGPLVNAKGELVGLMTFRYEDGPADNLHYAISATHLKKLMASAGTTAMPLESPWPALLNRTFPA